jgi:hypothetical protein
MVGFCKLYCDESRHVAIVTWHNVTWRNVVSYDQNGGRIFGASRLNMALDVFVAKHTH